MTRASLRWRTCAALALAFWVTAAVAENAEPIAVIGFELVDDHPDPARDASMRRRLAAIQAQLEAGLQERRLYRVVDTTPARDLIRGLRERHEFVYRCHACLADVGQRLGTRLVLVGWVQRVSELILNINVQVKDAETDAEVLSKSVDLRGNTDETWSRGVAFMLRDWSERRQQNPRYGL